MTLILINHTYKTAQITIVST